MAEDKRIEVAVEREGPSSERALAWRRVQDGGGRLLRLRKNMPRWKWRAVGMNMFRVSGTENELNHQTATRRIEQIRGHENVRNKAHMRPSLAHQREEPCLCGCL